MNKLYKLASALTFLVATTAGAQDGINNVLTNSVKTKPTFAVFDIRPADVDVHGIQEAVGAALKKFSDDVKINEQIAPYPLPVLPQRMTFVPTQSVVGTINVAECPQASSILSAVDKNVAKYGEISFMRVCIFQYRDGIRLNFYALFAQKSGGANVDVLGAMLGRAIGKAVGLGDSSKVITDTLSDIEQRLQQITPTAALVEMQPRAPGKVLTSDPAAALLAAAPAMQSTMEPQTAAPTSADATTPELAAAQRRAAATIAQRMAEMRGSTTGVATTTPQVGGQTPNITTAVQARKELSAMGLTYYSQDQFVDAVRRNDRIAFELFIKARGGITSTGADKNGVTPLHAAQDPVMKQLLQLF
jgi:hypothetical protein